MRGTKIYTGWFKTYCCGAQGVRNPIPEEFILLAISSGTLAKGAAWHII